MNPAQITMLIFILLALIFGAIVDGTERKGKHEFSITFVSILIYQSILYWGGFWKIGNN
jgi:hypothetical protein